jgi:hypothetical protein
LAKQNSDPAKTRSTLWSAKLLLISLNKFKSHISQNKKNRLSYPPYLRYCNGTINDTHIVSARYITTNSGRIAFGHYKFGAPERCWVRAVEFTVDFYKPVIRIYMEDLIGVDCMMR